MAKRPEWHDEYWLLLMQLYLKKPQGVKHLYSPGLVDVAMELHIPPQFIHQKMYELRRIDTPRMQRLWDEYANNPRKLARGIKLLRRMNGFGTSGAFYDGVEVEETWEKMFKPVAVKGYKGKNPMTPVKLIMILDLYFRLTPITMVPETPEIVELAKLIKSTPEEVADVMALYLQCDPYITTKETISSPLADACQEIWKDYGNEDPEKLAALAAQLKEYFTLR